MTSSPEVQLKAVELQLRQGTQASEHQPAFGPLGALLTYCPPRQYNAPSQPELTSVNLLDRLI